MSFLPLCRSGPPIFISVLAEKLLSSFLARQVYWQWMPFPSVWTSPLSLASFFEGLFPRGSTSSFLVLACVPVTELGFPSLLLCGSGVFCLWLMSFFILCLCFLWFEICGVYFWGHLPCLVPSELPGSVWCYVTLGTLCHCHFKYSFCAFLSFWRSHYTHYSILAVL